MAESLASAAPEVGDCTGLRLATTEDLPHLTSVLASAFHDDPIFSWLIESERWRLTRLLRFFGAELRHLALPLGRVWTTDDLSGAALVLPPGRWRVSPRATLQQGGAFWTGPVRAARLALAMGQRHSREVRTPHYYVRSIGVLPEAQGGGLGSALMHPTLDRCDRESVPAYLEASSERSAALYERLGFSPRGELRVAGGPPQWPMVREPRETAR